MSETKTVLNAVCFATISIRTGPFALSLANSEVVRLPPVTAMLGLGLVERKLTAVVQGVMAQGLGDRGSQIIGLEDYGVARVSDDLTLQLRTPIFAIQTHGRRIQWWNG